MSHGPKRIALLLPDLEIGGAQRTMLTLAREMQRAGLLVDIVSLTAGGPLTDECPPGVRLLALRPAAIKGTALFLGAIKPLLGYLADARPDAMLSTITGCNLLACAAQRLDGSRCRLVLREAVSLRNTTALRRFVLRWLYPMADAFVALSESLADELRQLGLREVHVIPNPVDMERLQALASQPLPPQLDGRAFVACVGRLVEQKDHATALRAFAALPDTCGHVLAIAGDGPLRDSLHALSTSLGLGGRVAWLGEVKNPYPLIAGADALLLTSRWEGTPNVLLEAMALGTPIIATDGPGGVRELLECSTSHRLIADDGSRSESVGKVLDEVLGKHGRAALFVAPARQPAAVSNRYTDLLLDGSNP